MVSALEQSIKQFRGNLFKQETDARRAVRRSYAVALALLRTDLAETLKRIEAIRAEGGEVRTWRLLEEQRLRQLIARAEIEFQRHADRVYTETIRAQQAAIQQAQAASKQLIEDAFGPGPPNVGLPVYLLPTGALTQLTTSLQPGAPVQRLLAEFAGDAAETVQNQIIGGVARGASPREITSAIVAELGASQRVRAERIVRTETMRAFRAASIETYKANRHLVTGWRWMAALDRRTCPICFANHGRVFPLDVAFASHANCRCIAAPISKSWRDLGYDVADNRPAITPGPDVFAAMPVADQRSILGNAAYVAFNAGDVDLTDFVGITRSAIWGTGRRRVSLAKALERGKKAA